MLSEFEIIVNTSGVTIICPYLYTPRFIPFDLIGRCKTCKSDNVEIDYIIQPEGITIFCSRLKKEKFVPFDKAAKINQKDADDNSRTVRIRSRSKSYNIPMRKELTSEVSEKNIKAPYDIPLNISDIPLPSLITQTPIEIPDNIPLNTLSHDARTPTERSPTPPSLENPLTTLTPLYPLSVVRTVRTPSPPLVVSPISFFSNL